MGGSPSAQARRNARSSDYRRSVQSLQSLFGCVVGCLLFTFFIFFHHDLLFLLVFLYFCVYPYFYIFCIFFFFLLIGFAYLGRGASPVSLTRACRCVEYSPAGYGRRKQLFSSACPTTNPIGNRQSIRTQSMVTVPYQLANQPNKTK